MQHARPLAQSCVACGRKLPFGRFIYCSELCMEASKALVREGYLKAKKRDPEEEW